MYNSTMKIIRLKKVDSTHRYLEKYIKENGYKESICIVSDNQTNGIGSRGNSWEGKKGNLFFSFVLDKTLLPSDLFLQSSSIYFAYILKMILKKKGSKLWVKWPNDFYLEDKKLGGIITTVSNKLLFCGIGLNLLEVSDDFAKLDIVIDVDEILKEYFYYLEKKILWKEVFSEFKIEFQNNKNFKATIDNKKVSLNDAILNDDGSITLKDKKVFSLR